MRWFPARVVPRSLIGRIGVALVLVGLVPIMVAWAIVFTQYKGPKAVDEYYLLLAGYAAQSVQQALEEGATAVEIVAQDTVIRSYRGDGAAVEGRLIEFNSLFPRFYHLTLVSLNGQAMASSTYRYWGGWGQMTAFQKARSGEVAISSAHLPLGTQEPMVSFAAPVRDQQDQPASVLIAEAPVASVTSLATGLEVGKEGRAFVVNSLEQVIAHREAGQLMTSWALPGMEAAPGPALFTAREDGRDYLYAVAPVTAGKMLEEWSVVLRISADEAYAFFIRTQRLDLVIALATLLAIVLVAAGLAISIGRPVRKVAAAASRMAAGDLGVRVQEHAGGELGEMAGSFNVMAEKLQANISALQESRKRIVAVEEGVRRDIAAHLHGRVQGKLLALRGRLQQLLGQTDQQSEASQVLGEVVDDMGREVVQELSLVSRRLYPSILRRGLIPALQSLGDQFETAVAIDMRLDAELERSEGIDHSLVPEPVRLAIYRIAEEALTNVVKHSGASQATVELSFPSEGWLRLAVRDNGRGFDMAGVGSGMGTASMRDYAESVGGKCTLSSAPGRGTEVIALLSVAMPGAGQPETSPP
ncbi:MAG: HAMP domain-containing protein [Chloroflexi bacterium]|nr:HAMP domain-containing protein [Chloroflexota bacterium]